MVIRRYRIQWGNELFGLCCDIDDNRIYCAEQRGDTRNYTHWLTVYYMGVDEDDSFSLLDKVEVKDMILDCHPRVDSSHQVYVPCGRSGVRVFRLQDGRLLQVISPLTCLASVWSICVNTAESVFAFDLETNSVCLVNVYRDKVIRRLERPKQVRHRPQHASVLGQMVLVWYCDNTLVTYHRDSPTPGQVIYAPKELFYVSGIATDSHSCIITDSCGFVYVLDVKLLWHRIYTDKEDWRRFKDCCGPLAAVFGVFRWRHRCTITSVTDTDLI